MCYLLVWHTDNTTKSKDSVLSIVEMSYVSLIKKTIVSIKQNVVVWFNNFLGVCYWGTFAIQVTSNRAHSCSDQIESRLGANTMNSMLYRG